MSYVSATLGNNSMDVQSELALAESIVTSERDVKVFPLSHCHIHLLIILTVQLMNHAVMLQIHTQFRNKLQEM